MPPLRLEQPLRFESQTLPLATLLKKGAYAIIGVVAAWIFIAFWNVEILDTSSLLTFVIAMAVFGVIEVMASRTRTIISIRDDIVTIQTNSIVTGSFALSDIAEFESDAVLPNNVLPTPIEVSKVVTRSNLIFYIPTGSLSPGDKRQLIGLLASCVKNS